MLPKKDPKDKDGSKPVKKPAKKKKPRITRLPKSGQQKSKSAKKKNTKLVNVRQEKREKVIKLINKIMESGNSETADGSETPFTVSLTVNRKTTKQVKTLPKEITFKL